MGVRFTLSLFNYIIIGGISPKSTDPKTYFPYYSHCAFNSINDGVDDGAVNRSTCRLEKRSNDTILRLTFNGNMRVTGCSDCCARWYLTVDGYECTMPIEGVIYTRSGSTINIHRAAQISGLCNGTTSNPAGITSGAHIVRVNVGKCMGFNDTFNAYTGFSTISTLTIEELPSSCMCVCVCVCVCARARVHMLVHVPCAYYM